MALFVYFFIGFCKSYKLGIEIMIPFVYNDTILLKTAEPKRGEPLPKGEYIPCIL